MSSGAVRRGALLSLLVVTTGGAGFAMGRATSRMEETARVSWSSSLKQASESVRLFLQLESLRENLADQADLLATRLEELRDRRAVLLAASRRFEAAEGPARERRARRLQVRIAMLGEEKAQVEQALAEMRRREEMLRDRLVSAIMTFAELLDRLDTPSGGVVD